VSRFSDKYPGRLQVAEAPLACQPRREAPLLCGRRPEQRGEREGQPASADGEQSPHPVKKRIARQRMFWGAKYPSLTRRVEAVNTRLRSQKKWSFRARGLEVCLLPCSDRGARVGIQCGIKRSQLGCPEIFNTIEAERPQSWSASPPRYLVFYFILLFHTSAWHWWSARARSLTCAFLVLRPASAQAAETAFCIMWVGLALNVTTGLFF